MLLGVVSDTHGQVSSARDAARMLESLGAAAILHCGDIGSTEIVRLFQKWPTHFVLGNVDEAWEDALAEEIAGAGLHFHGLFGSVEFDGRNIALLHGHEGGRLRQTIDAGRWDLVCYGHTHVAMQERVGPTLVLNPGALHRARQHTVAIVDLESMEATHVPV